MTSVLVLIAAFPLTSLLSYFLKSSLILWIPFQFPSWSGSLLSFLITNILHYLFSYVKSFCCLTFPIKTLAACPSGSNNLWLRLTLLSKCFSVLGCTSQLLWFFFKARYNQITNCLILSSKAHLFSLFGRPRQCWKILSLKNKQTSFWRLLCKYHLTYRNRDKKTITKETICYHNSEEVVLVC